MAASMDSLILPSTSTSSSTSTPAASPSSSSGSMWPAGDVSTPETEEELGEIVALPRLGPAFFEAAEPPQEFVFMDHFDRWIEWYGPDDQINWHPSPWQAGIEFRWP
ncbi:hypothetical protein SAY87_008744 [Trapa incisa]|uniref:Uncharacterized protein n=1 Tax=Trapa incisa TaxID=236973 RepID=A0AAN7JXP9_9MYRT|nr:hypothetical protein SAY87_008744 [Trapa incisa]